MKPGAHLQSVIVLIEKLLSTSTPADHLLNHYFRKNRYIGSKDRQTITHTFYDILRKILFFNEIINRYTPELSSLQEKSRYIVLSYLFLKKKDISAVFNGDNYHPSPLTFMEQQFLSFLARYDIDSTPVCFRYNLPPWLYEKLKDYQNFQELAFALNQSAPLDLRVNTLKTTREEVLAHLKDIKAEPTPLSPIGIRIIERLSFTNHFLWKKGHIEIQDEGSQLLSLLVDAKPGMTVLDLCAGAGGKTLAMAACMKNKDKIIACDILPWRLERSKKRLRRAGVYNVELCLLDIKGYQWLKRQQNRFDRILIDAPCSGVGTLRRNPDLVLRLQEQDLIEITEKQKKLLDQVKTLVALKGRVIYGTCSLLTEENENIIKNFINASSNYRLLDIPLNLSVGSLEPNALKLNPYHHQTDGFFGAVLERMSC